VSSALDVDLAHDVGRQAHLQAMRSMMTALELIPDGKTRTTAMCVALAYIQMKIDGFKLLMPPDQLRAYEGMIEILLADLPAAVSGATGRTP
jgi:hypothetical protein